MVLGTMPYSYTSPSELTALLAQAEILPQVQQIATAYSAKGTACIAQQVCTQLDIRGRKGRFPFKGCRKALYRLAKKGRLTLPEAKPREMPVKSSKVDEIYALLSKPDALSRVKQIIAANPGNIELSARTICAEFSIQGSRGRLCTHSCVRALYRLEEGRLLTILRASLPTISGQIDTTAVTLVAAVDDTSKALAAALMAEKAEHIPPIVAPLVSYLVYAGSMPVGLLVYSAAAKAIEVRDNFIGWTHEECTANRTRLVRLSYVSFREGVDATNIAPRAIRLSTESVADDVERLHHYRPLVAEAYFENQTKSSWFEEADWINVGDTKGRGRDDADRAAQVSQKKVFLYILNQNFRKEMKLLCYRA